MRGRLGMNIRIVSDQFIQTLKEVAQPPHVEVRMAKSEEVIPLVHVDVTFHEGKTIRFVLDENYPKSAPTIYVKHGEDIDRISVLWDLTIPVVDRIRNQLKPFLSGLPLQKAYGPPNGLILTNDEEEASTANWSTFISPIEPEETKKKIQEGLYARTLGILSKDVSDKNVMIVGVGSVGSYIAEQLARNGVTQFTFIDPDIVEFPNLSRTVYNLHDIEVPKVKALTRHLLNINPSIKITSYENDILKFSPGELQEMFENVDFVVATTDEPAAQRVINRFAYGLNLPAIYVGLYAGADGGEAILSIPEETPCYLCATSIRHQYEQAFEQVSARTDYGTGKLVGEVALSVDIQHVTSAAIKLILSLLIPKDSDVRLKDFVPNAMERGFNYLTLSMKDSYWFYPKIFNEVPGQYAYQGAWLTATTIEECAICGNPEFRESLNKPLTTPNRSAFAKVLKGSD